MDLKILSHILEDDADIHEIIQDYVQKHKLNQDLIFYYSSPKIFLENVGEDISVCVIDHKLPDGMTGLNVIRAVKSKNKYSFVIIMSGQTDMKVVEDYINCGANKYIDKNRAYYRENGEEINKHELLVEYLKEGLGEAIDRIQFANFRKSIEENQRKVGELIDTANSLRNGSDTPSVKAT